MRTLLTLALLALLGVFGAAATGAPIPKEAKKTLPEKLMGEWRLVKTDASVKPAFEFSIHFKKDGALEFHRQYPDREAIISKGKYKAADKAEKYPDGSIDWSIGEGDNALGEISKILKLNDDELVFEDPEGLKESFVRVKVVKKTDK